MRVKCVALDQNIPAFRVEKRSIDWCIFFGIILWVF